MKLAIITSHINKSLQWQWTSEGFVASGIDHIHIIINDEEPRLSADLENLGVKVYWLRHRGAFSHLINLLRVVRILRRHKIDVVHTSLPYGNLIGQTAAMLCRIRSRITTCENASWAEDFQSRKQRLIDKWTYLLAHKIIATSEPAHRYLIKNWGLSQDKLVVIGHALKADDFRNIAPERVTRLRSALKLDDKAFVVGVVARFEYWKGHIHIVEAMRMLAKDYPDLRVLIFGAKGSEYDKVMGTIQEYGLSEIVQYRGFVDDPIALYQLFDIHVHVPINEYVETFGINIIEGMMSGCAQILTKSGVAFSSARHMSNCLVVDYCDPESIARAIVVLKTDRNLAVRLGQQARQDALEKFSVQAKISAHLLLYGQFCEVTNTMAAG